MPTPEVDGGETLYRQAFGGDPPYYWAGRQFPVHRSLFKPNSNDTDGLSLIRSRFRSPVWAAYRPEKPTARFTLICLNADQLAKLAAGVGFEAFEYASTPDGLDNRNGEPYAHCVASRINIRDYRNDDEACIRMKEWAYQLEKKLTSEDTLGPFHDPMENDPYRPS